MLTTNHWWKGLTLAFSLIIASASSLAQISQEGNIWYFGNGAGLDFAGGSPTAINNGQMNNLEGVASIANKQGQILFYSDGMEVYNKYHQLLNPTADLNGHNSSTQSGVIVPQPVRGNRFYLFTVDEEGGALEYAILDSNGSGGTGSIFSRNHSLLSSSTEKITAVMHANKTDIWIIAHEWGNNKFHAWLLTGAGLSSSSVVSTVGPSHSGNTGYSKGYMKASPDGTQLALAVVGAQQGWNTTNDGRWELYDFNNQTGAVTNPKIFNNSNKPSAVNEYDGAYGIEFSPNGRFIYVSCWNVRGSNDRLFQFDLKAGTRSFTDINNSAYQVASSQGGADFGALQLGPDGRIYIARGNRTSLSMIVYPNCPTTNSGYTDGGPSLGTNRSRYGLPTFIQTFFNEPEFDFGDSTGSGTGICLGDSTQFWLYDYNDLDSVQWFFGDPNSGTANNFSNLINPKHVFSGTGNFTVKAIIYRAATTLSCDLDTVERVVTIIPLPEVDLGPDTMFCEGMSYSKSMQNFSQPNATYRWSGGSTAPSKQMTQSGTYWAEKTNEGCSASDTLTLTFVPYPVLSLPPDTFVCLPDSFFTYAGPADSFNWSTGQTDTAIYIKSSGTFSVIATNAELCTSYDTIVISTIADLGLSLPASVQICEEDTIEINAYKGIDGYTYEWSTGSTDSAITVYQQGLYVVQVYDTFCTYFDSVNLIVQTPPVIDLGEDTVLCKNETHVLHVPLAGASFVWHDASTDSSFNVTTAGLKHVEVTYEECEVSDSILVEYIILPDVDLGNDTTVCEGQFVDFVLTASGDWAYIWNESTMADSFRVDQAGQYRVALVDTPGLHCVEFDTINVAYQSSPQFSLGNDTTLCPGDSIILDITGFPNLVSFKWFDFNNALQRRNHPTITDNWVELFDGVCTIVESIEVDYYPAITADIGDDLVLCDNETEQRTISTNIGSVFRWENISGAVLSNTQSYTITSPDQYVGYTSNGFCEKRDTMLVEYFTTPLFEMGNDTTYCSDFSRTFVISAPADTYQWSDGGSGNSMTISSPGKYWARAANNICSHRDSIYIQQMAPPDLDTLLSDQFICELETYTVTYNEQPFTTYYWEDGSSLNPRTVGSIGDYLLVAVNECGIDSAGFAIQYKTSGCRVDIPTAFSPNGDNLNEVFKIVGEAQIHKEMLIYNRWGELVFNGNPLEGWDGTYQGKECPTGYYVYYISYKRTESGHGRWYYMKGVVYLTR